MDRKEVKQIRKGGLKIIATVKVSDENRMN